MKLWGYKKNSSCCLCGAPNCTLHHILSNCSTALTQKRFTWRHDSVLSVIYQALNCHIQTTNLNQQASKPAFIQFVQAGHQIVKNNKPIQFNLLSNTNDWKLLADLPGCNYVFPPEIFSTAERPDITIWSTKIKKVILIELTCPAEEGIEAAQVRKISKYLPLVKDISSMTAWKPLLFTIEIGVRGFIAISTRQVFLKLGLPTKLLNELLNRLSTIAAKCSYTIFLASNSITWDKSQALIGT